MTSPLEQCRDALSNFIEGCSTGIDAGAVGRAAIAAADAALQQESATFSAATILPDGSAFATASWPLPKDHWLYAPRGEWDSVRDEYAECPAPILNNSYVQAVRAAIKYAVRGATMCGQEMDFDPDAMVQNAVYALCGPANAAVLPVDAQSDAALAAQGEPHQWQIWCDCCEGAGNVHQESQRGVIGSGGTFACPDCDGNGYRLKSLYAAPVAAPVAQPQPCMGDDCAELASLKDSYGQLLAENVRLRAAPVAQGWQPIETAPKDWAILLYGAKRTGMVVGMNHSRDGWVIDTPSEWVGMYPPKHWMPLPAAPKKSA